MHPDVVSPPPSRGVRAARHRTSHGSPVQLHLRALIGRIAAASDIRHGQQHDPSTRAILDGDRAPCLSLERACRSLVPRFPTRAASEQVQLIPQYLALDIAAMQDEAFGPVTDDEDLEAVLIAEAEQEGVANKATLRAIAHPTSVGDLTGALDSLLLHRAAIDRAARVLHRRLALATQGAAA